jgi:hypothetical protein
MAQNGSADVSIEASSSLLPTVVGINYGNSYASIAVVSKARAHLFTIWNQVIAHSSCRKDWQIVLQTRTVNVRLPPLFPSMAKKQYAFYSPYRFRDLTNDAGYSISAQAQNISWLKTPRTRSSASGTSSEESKVHSFADYGAVLNICSAGFLRYPRINS